MSAVAQESSYGRQFAPFYDRLFPADETSAAAVDRLADLHVAGAGPPIEFGAGTGRVALPLARRVGPVVGVDASREMLDQLSEVAARADDESLVEPVEGDMRDYRARDDHGLVYCILGSLSILLERDEQRAALRTLAAAAAPGAAVVVETHNPAFVRALHDGRATTSWLVPYEQADTALLSHVTLDARRELWQLAHIFFDAGRARVAAETSRLIEPDALDEMASAAGLQAEARHGGWNGDAPHDGAPMLVSTYRRPI